MSHKELSALQIRWMPMTRADLMLDALGEVEVQLWSPGLCIGLADCLDGVIKRAIESARDTLRRVGVSAPLWEAWAAERLQRGILSERKWELVEEKIKVEYKAEPARVMAEKAAQSAFTASSLGEEAIRGFEAIVNPRQNAEGILEINDTPLYTRRDRMEFLANTVNIMRQTVEHIARAADFMMAARANKYHMFSTEAGPAGVRELGQQALELRKMLVALVAEEA